MYAEGNMLATQREQSLYIYLSNLYRQLYRDHGNTGAQRSTKLGHKEPNPICVEMQLRLVVYAGVFSVNAAPHHAQHRNLTILQVPACVVLT